VFLNGDNKIIDEFTIGAETRIVFNWEESRNPLGTQ